MVAHRGLHQCVTKPSAKLIEINKVLASLTGRVRIALAKERLDHLLEQADFAVGSDLPSSEVADISTSIQQLLGGAGDIECTFAVDPT